MPLTEDNIKGIVKAILAVSQPTEIVLFGSYARGNPHESSDIDFLVIRSRDFAQGESRRKELGKLYRSVSSAATPQRT
jgi:predicted nucleotidyltransferase